MVPQPPTNAEELMAKITDINHAGRLARTMASDIAIYNTDKIKRGIENDLLFEELEDDLRDGLAMWNNKVDESITVGTNLLQKAFVDIIFANQGEVSSKIFGSCLARRAACSLPVCTAPLCCVGPPTLPNRFIVGLSHPLKCGLVMAHGVDRLRITRGRAVAVLVAFPARALCNS